MILWCVVVFFRNYIKLQGLQKCMASSLCNTLYLSHTAAQVACYQITWMLGMTKLIIDLCLFKQLFNSKGSLLHRAICTVINTLCSYFYSQIFFHKPVLISGNRFVNKHSEAALTNIILDYEAFMNGTCLPWNIHYVSCFISIIWYCSHSQTSQLKCNLWLDD